MKKTLSINLNQSVYQIDEDAYSQLHGYLECLKKHFADEEGADEIMEDIEARIAELFKERMRFGMQVVTLRDVDEVVAIMGHPEEIDQDSLKIDPDNYTERTISGEPEFEPGEPTPLPSSVKKRLYRDSDNRILGGVASGLGFYLGIDATWIRILFIIFTLLWGTSIWVYLLLWIIVPEARTTSQKLEMRGDPVTIENIKKLVIDEMDKTSETINEQSEKVKPVLIRVFNVVLEIIRRLLQFVVVVFGGCLGFLLLIILFACGVSALSLFFVGFNVDSLIPLVPHEIVPYISEFGNPWSFIFGVILTFGIPAYALLHYIISNVFHKSRMNKITAWTLFGLWLLGVALLIFFSVKLGSITLTHFPHII